MMARCPECGQKDCCGASMSEEINRLTAQLAEAKAIINDLSGKHGMQTGDMTGNSFEWRTKCVMLEKHLAERDAEIAEYLEIMRIAGVGPHKANYTLGKLTLNGELNVLKQENTTLREEMERLSKLDGEWCKTSEMYRKFEAEARKQAAQEICKYLHSSSTDDEISKSYTIDNIKSKFGLEG